MRRRTKHAGSGVSSLAVRGPGIDAGHESSRMQACGVLKHVAIQSIRPFNGQRELKMSRTPGSSGTSSGPKSRSRGRASAGAPPSGTGVSTGSETVTGLGAAAGRSEPPRATDNVIERSSLQPVTRPQASQPQVLEGMPASSEVPPEDRLEEIARSAYYRAEKRGFIPGYELDDWLEAEREYLERDGGLDLR